MFFKVVLGMIKPYDHIIDNLGKICTMIPDYQDIKIMTVQEVANLLRVHRTTVSRYAMSGELRSYIIGTRRLFRFNDVLSFFENQKDPRCVFGKENE